ncbi:type II toxin-antitoxin system RelE/ParE family toxin [Campylobacter sp. 1BO]|uniref:type II toxin-antitoxin system RelE/ParE family toxin n=1 Tax=Campylobacter sp. 1BO TaxID=3424760 RepID=UPI003D32AF50
MPPKISANMSHIIALFKEYGNQIGEPQTKSIGSGLFEIRAKGSEGIARRIYCYEVDTVIYILKVFVKKSNKISAKELEVARRRLKELRYGSRD